LKVLVHFLRVKRDQRATRPLQVLFSSNPSNKNFERTIFFKWFKDHIMETGVNTIPQGPRAGVISYILGVYMVVIEGILIYTSERGHLIGN
jgi:hypothetical protein